MKKDSYLLFSIQTGKQHWSTYTYICRFHSVESKLNKGILECFRNFVIYQKKERKLFSYYFIAEVNACFLLK